jgi:hypothetical protein
VVGFVREEGMRQAGKEIMIGAGESDKGETGVYGDAYGWGDEVGGEEAGGFRLGDGRHATALISFRGYGVCPSYSADSKFLRCKQIVAGVMANLLPGR